eukprot:TRINITY_DN76884_c0_g1_i1.p1 TRINITY_DN76884_c0_g1~~TRINITY_DN76884_c0_g1_i1.p1  ORF type:complete len:437 (-),score=96.96 TRINITY_DN76884_c0_g1_i1:39-1349(-)
MASTVDLTLDSEDQEPQHVLLSSASLEALAKGAPGLARLLENLCVDDVDPRHQRLRLNNATLRERVLEPLPGAVDLLCFLGYSQLQESGEDFLCLDLSRHSTEMARKELQWLQQFIEQRWRLPAWNCPTCTLINQPEASRCDACNEPRPGWASTPKVQKPSLVTVAAEGGAPAAASSLAPRRPVRSEKHLERERILAEARADRERFAPAAASAPFRAAASAGETTAASAGDAAPVAQSLPSTAALRIRLPDGAVMEETFNASDRLQKVFEHLNGLGCASGSYSLLQAIPRRVFIQEVLGNRSLAELGLVPSATLSVLRSEDRGRVQSGGVETALLTGNIDGLSYEEMLELESRMGSATPSHLSRPSKRTRDARTCLYTFSADADCTGGDKRCAICLDNFQVGNELRKLWCSHSFHRKCVDTWLAEKDECPVCRDTC